MSLNKNKSEIVESFKNLLKKADEVKHIQKETNNIQDMHNYETNLVDERINQVTERDTK